MPLAHDSAERDVLLRDLWCLCFVDLDLELLAFGRPERAVVVDGADRVGLVFVDVERRRLVREADAPLAPAASRRRRGGRLRLVDHL